MKQVYVQYDEIETSLVHDYDIEVDSNLTYLKYSDNPEWLIENRGGICGSIIDSGNGISIQMKFMETLELDYTQAQELLILLLHNCDARIEIRESKVIKSI